MSLEQKAKLSELSVWDDIERRRPSSPDSGILAMGWGEGSSTLWSLIQKIYCGPSDRKAHSLQDTVFELVP